MCECHVDAVPNGNNVKQNSGHNVLAKLIAAGYAATTSIKSSPNQ